MSAVVPSLVAGWAERAGESVAVVDPGGRSLTYADLVGRADRLARALVARGVRPGDVVGVHADRDDVSLAVALLGVWRAGAAYLPLDPRQPSVRSRFMLGDVDARFVVGSVGEDLADLADVVTAVPVPSVADDDPEVVLPEVSPSDLAYVIYTSGSTGSPKGVAVEHGSVARLFDRVAESFTWSAGDVWSCFHSVAFDFSVWELWGALSSGGTVALVSYADSRDPEAFPRFVEQHGVTMVSLTPSALARLLPHGGLDRVRHVVLGGEAVRLGELGELLARPDRPKVWNLYGITETTVHATVRELSADDTGCPIGNPLSDLTFAVVDTDGAEVPAGERGELWISGAGVAREYVNRPELTAERFVDATVGGVPGRWYRTGDAVRVLASGEFEYVGRLDRQVKLRGFRIELGEVEAVLGAHDGVGAAAVELVDDDGDARLVGYVTMSGAAADLREWVSARLPEHMVPSVISVVEAMPVTDNGKLDRAALRAMPTQPLPAPESVVELASETERRLAGIWAEVLGKTGIGRDDYFFTIGGDSMLALRLVALMSRELGFRVGIATLYRHATLAELAAWVDETREKAAGATR